MQVRRFSAPTPWGSTHRWQSGPVLWALHLAVVLEPIGALVVGAVHLTISAILPSTTPSASTTGATSGAKSPCASLAPNDESVIKDEVK